MVTQSKFVVIFSLYISKYIYLYFFLSKHNLCYNLSGEEKQENEKKKHKYFSIKMKVIQVFLVTYIYLHTYIINFSIYVVITFTQKLVFQDDIQIDPLYLYTYIHTYIYKHMDIYIYICIGINSYYTYIDIQVYYIIRVE